MEFCSMVYVYGSLVGSRVWELMGTCICMADTPILWTPDGQADSFEKTLMLGKIEGRKRRGQQRMRRMASPTQWTWVWVNSGSWWWTRRPGVLWFMGSQRVGHDWANELNWTELMGWFMLRFDRKQQNSIKQLFFNKKTNKKILLSCLKCMYLLFLLKTDV